MINPDFRDILALLSEEGAEFIVVGAYAVAAHGAPRSTGDIDVFVRPTPENAARVWRALRRFGAPLTDLSARDLENPDLIFQIGVQPCRIDVITSISGVEFEQAWRNRLQYEVEGQVVPVLGWNELITNKKASGRHKDLQDVEVLQRLAERTLPPASAKPLPPASPRRKRR